MTELCRNCLDVLHGFVARVDLALASKAGLAMNQGETIKIHDRYSR